MVEVGAVVDVVVVEVGVVVDVVVLDVVLEVVVVLDVVVVGAVVDVRRGGRDRLTVKVKAWVAVPAPFVAVRVTVKIPALVSLPTSVAMPLSSSSFRPRGPPAAIATVGAGNPLVMTGNFKALPAPALAEPGLSKMGNVGFTVIPKGTVQVPLALDAFICSS